MWARAAKRSISEAILAGGMVVCLGITPPAWAEESQTPAAYVQALEAFQSAWDAAPFGFAVATFVDQPAKGYGLYAPRESATFETGQALHVYAEPVAYGFKAEKEAQSYALKAAFQLLTPSGQVLAEEEQFAEFKGTTRSRKQELSTQLSFGFEGLPVGSYTLEITMTDEVGDQTALIALPFSVISPQ